MADQNMQTVELSVPAEPSYARSVRMLAANLAVLAGLSVEDVEDVRMAAEEGFVWCCATRPDACLVRFGVEDGSLRLEFSLGQAELAADERTSTYAELILTAVCDECVTDREAGLLRLRKSAGALDA